jgi:5-methyltetrahydrofolate--homocysteine methyltransferase
VYVLDASRAVVVVNNLLDPNNSSEYKKDISAEYEQIRKDYFKSVKEKSFVSLHKARSKKLQTDWNKQSIVRPKQVGEPIVFNNYDLNKLLPFIDWDPFF